ncbi:MAG: IS1182 family transposase [Coriobacteriales bacterium]|jgi:transposase|nr:IS1182 family transposase [Coriobacteriales bacterium]
MGHIPEGDRMQSRILCLDDMVARDSMARIVDRFIGVVDLGALGFANTTPRDLGRSSYSPNTMAKIYVFAYEQGIRSSRKIEHALRTNVEFMWLCGGLEPDFKTIADFRRDNTGPLSSLFYEFASFADSAGMYGKKVVAIDGTKIRASNSKRRNISGKSLKRRIQYHGTRVAQYMRELEDADDAQMIGELSDKAKKAMRSQAEAQSLLDGMVDGGMTEVSLTDADARCMGKGRQGMHVAYNVQAAVDSKHHLIAEMGITNRPDDHGELSNMARLTQESLRKRDITFLADKGYWGSEDLGICRSAGIDCIVAPQARCGNRQEKDFALDAFTYDPATDSYLCPLGQRLTCRSRPATKKRIYDNKPACRSCKQAEKCKSGALGHRRITRGPGSDVLDWAYGRYQDNLEIYGLRQQLVEHPFGTIKRTMGADHFLLRGMEKVRCEAALLFVGYNLKRVRNVLGFDAIMAKLDEYATLIGAGNANLSSHFWLYALFGPLYVTAAAFWRAMAAICPVGRGGAGPRVAYG